MKQPLLLGAIVLLLTGCATTPTAEPERLRVMAYNIHAGRGMDGEIDLPRIADVIKRSGADIVALQEVDNKTRRSGQVDQTTELAELTGMFGAFGSAFDYQGGQYGQAILSRFPISDLTVHQLPGAAEDEQRIGIFGRIDIPSHPEPLLIIGTHLHHQAEQHRLAQSQRLLELVEDEDRSRMILLGDLNAQPNSRTMTLFKQTWLDTTPDDHLTFPADKPNRKIDYILLPLETEWEIVYTEVPEEPVTSDHRPVLVELRRQAR